MSLPQDDWHHAMVVIDESHLFAPQHDKSEAKKAVIDLAGRGRKRGLCPVLATQRLSKLNKNVAADLQNRLIGQTILDVDIRRAADELGISATDAAATLPELNPGEFFVYGPAICRRVCKATIGAVDTAHGANLGAIAPPARCSDNLIADIAERVNYKEPEPASPQTGTTAAGASPVPAARPAIASGAPTVRPPKSETEADDRLWEQIAQARYEAIKPALTAAHGKQSQEIAAAAAKAGVSTATIAAWIQTYRRSGKISSLAPKRRTASAGDILARITPVGSMLAEAESAPPPAVAPRLPGKHLDPAQRERLSYMGFGERHLQVLEQLRNGLDIAGVAAQTGMSAAEAQACTTLMSVLVGAQSTAQLLARIDDLIRNRA